MLSNILISNQSTSINNGIQIIAIQAIQPFSFQLLSNNYHEFHMKNI